MSCKVKTNTVTTNTVTTKSPENSPDRISVTVPVDKKTITKAMESIEAFGDFTSYFLLTCPLSVVIHTTLGASQVFAAFSISLCMALKAPAENIAKGLSYGAGSIANVTKVSKKSYLHPIASRIHSVASRMQQSLDKWLEKEPSQWRSSDVEPMMKLACQNIIRGLLIDVIPLPYLGAGLAVYDIATKYRLSEESPYVKNTVYESFHSK